MMMVYHKGHTQKKKTTNGWKFYFESFTVKKKAQFGIIRHNAIFEWISRARHYDIYDSGRPN